jgi:hypothetical protein
MSDCNHIIGSDECDCYVNHVYANESPPVVSSKFTPFKFCPICGVAVAEISDARAKLYRDYKL